MIEGTGPGRGFPWWRKRVILLTLRHESGFGREHAGRHGRLIAKIK